MPLFSDQIRAAMPFHQQALQIYSQLGNRRSAATTLWNMALEQYKLDGRARGLANAEAAAKSFEAL